MFNLFTPVNHEIIFCIGPDKTIKVPEHKKIFFEILMVNLPVRQKSEKKLRNLFS